MSEPKCPVPDRIFGPTFGRQRRNPHSAGHRNNPSHLGAPHLVECVLQVWLFVRRITGGVRSLQTRGPGNAVGLPRSGSECVPRVSGPGLRYRSPNADSECWKCFRFFDWGSQLGFRTWFACAESRVPSRIPTSEHNFGIRSEFGTYSRKPESETRSWNPHRDRNSKSEPGVRIQSQDPRSEIDLERDLVSRSGSEWWP